MAAAAADPHSWRHQWCAGRAAGVSAGMRSPGQVGTSARGAMRGSEPVPEQAGYQDRAPRSAARCRADGQPRTASRRYDGGRPADRDVRSRIAVTTCKPAAQPRTGQRPVQFATTKRGQRAAHVRAGRGAQHMITVNRTSSIRPLPRTRTRALGAAAAGALVTVAAAPVPGQGARRGAGAGSGRSLCRASRPGAGLSRRG